VSEKKPAKSRQQQARVNESVGGPMDVALLKELVQLMAANDLCALDLRDGQRRISLKRSSGQIPPPATLPVAAGPAAAQLPAPPAASVASPEPAEPPLKAITSPMVGTFYAAASPDAKPFVTVGSYVDEDTDVCIIEAMKVFNNIKAECRGTIVKILVNNGQAVEFGQTLFLVKPSP